jgi:hypothetical protein
MTQISIPRSLGLGLERVKELVEVRDETGAVVGHFIPASKSSASAAADFDCPYSDEDLKADLADALNDPNGGKPLSQIWKELEQA